MLTLLHLRAGLLRALYQRMCMVMFDGIQVCGMLIHMCFYAQAIVSAELLLSSASHISFVPTFAAAHRLSYAQAMQLMMCFKYLLLKSASDFSPRVHLPTGLDAAELCPGQGQVRPH